MTKRLYVVIKKQMLEWKPHKHDPILMELHAKRLYDHQIAYRMGFSRTTVSKHRRRLGLPVWGYIHEAPYKPTEQERFPGLAVNTNLAISPLDAARIYLGKRFETRGGNLWLDNCPSNLNTIMKEANKVMSNMGLPQIVRNPAWEHTPCP